MESEKIQDSQMTNEEAQPEEQNNSDAPKTRDEQIKESVQDKKL